METKNVRDLLNDPRIREPWPDKFVDWNARRDTRILDELAKVLEGAEDEKPLQKFYTEHPYLLAIAFRPHRCWVFPLPRLGGGKHIPDFLYCDHNSLGYHWTLVELESPRVEATNKDESISHATHHAVEQIRDYRNWLTANALAEQKEYRSITDKCDGLIAIGRRDGRSELEQQRLAEYKQQHIEIASYDRLLYQAREHLSAINASWKSAAEMAEKVRQIRTERL